MSFSLFGTWNKYPWDKNAGAFTQGWTMELRPLKSQLYGRWLPIGPSARVVSGHFVCKAKLQSSTLISFVTKPPSEQQQLQYSINLCSSVLFFPPCVLTFFTIKPAILCVSQNCIKCFHQNFVLFFQRETVLSN